MAVKDFFFELPLHFLQDPSMLRLMQACGMEGVGCYVGLCTALTIAYNDGRRIDMDALDALAYSWHIPTGQLIDMCGKMASFGLISAELWEDGCVGIDVVAERAMYRRRKAEAGSAGGKARAINAGQGIKGEQ